MLTLLFENILYCSNLMMKSWFCNVDIFFLVRAGIYNPAISQKMKNREEFEGGLNKSPQKQARIFGWGRGMKFCWLTRIYTPA